MAKRVTLNQGLIDPDKDNAAVATIDQEQEQSAPTKKTASKSTKRRAAAGREPAAGKRRPAKKAAAASRAAKELPIWATDEVTVRAADTKSTKPFNVALHPDDLQALDMAKVQTGYGDRQARIRTMVALWRGNPEFREAVEQRAQNAPRGGY